MVQLKNDEMNELMFDLVVEGIETRMLSSKFRIIIDGIEYGFPCKIEGDKVKISVPALDTILKESKAGVYKARLEVVGNNAFLVPWEDEIEIKIEPKVIATVEKSHDIVTENVKVRAFLSSSVVNEEKPKRPAGKTNSGLRKLMQ